jgi:tetratricopeptide (TPR) repeat protein
MQNNPIIQSRFKAAMQTLRGGKAFDALNQFESILKTNPNVPEAHFQAAQILMQSKQQRRAVDHLAKARDLAPTQPAVWQASLVAVGALGDTDLIAAFVKEVKKSKLPTDVRKKMLTSLTKPSGSEWGGAPKIEVDALIKTLIERNATDAMPRAKALHNQFQDVGLITNALATAYELSGETETADLLYRRAVLQAPFDVSIRMNYGRFLRSGDHNVGSLTHLRRADEMRPNTLEILLARAESAIEAGEPHESLQAAEAALRIDPNHNRGKWIKSKALSDLNRSDEAILINQELVELKPENGAYWLELGVRQEHLGMFEDAEKSLLTALDVDPNRSAAYREISAIRKFKANDPMFERLEKETEKTELSNSAKTSLHFALGKMHEDIKNFDKAFSHIKTANDLDREEFPFNHTSIERRHDALKAFRHRIDLTEVANSATLDDAPIFVTGLPRSGTTLSSKIVSTHSKTTDVGEARWSQAAMNDFWSDMFSGSVLPEGLTARIHKIGNDYVSLAAIESAGHKRIVDKSLMNHEFMGLFAAAMPNAKFVVLKRDPRDNLLSIYKNQFNSKVVPFNNDFDALAWTYAKFLGFVEFWKEVFPDRIYSLDYDALTADPETISREVLEFCGLKWEDDVLNFHEKETTVRTLSSYQVRQPIYQSSVRSWERYGNDLDPLIDALKKHGVPLPD